MNKKFSDAIAGYLFILPVLLLFIILTLGPLVGTLLLSFSKFSLLSSSRWVGLSNFFNLFSDARMGVIYGNTLFFVFILVPLHVIVGLVLAVSVEGLTKGSAKYLFRTTFFFPVLATTASVAIAWGMMFDTSFGLINWFIGLIGAKAIPWLNSPVWVYVAVAIFSLWKFIGNSFIYFLVGLQSIPVELYEAAMLDGASPRQRFFRITLPMLSPTMFFVVVNLIIGAAQIFDEPYFLTAGGPGDSSRTVGLYIYETAFQYHNYSYGSAVALSLFLVILLVTLLQFKLQKKWVFYGN